MVKMDELEWSTTLYQVREVWYTALLDFPSRGQEVRIVGDVRLVGVYRTLKTAKITKRRKEMSLQKMMEEKDEVARKRMFVKHMIRESTCAPAGYGATISSFSCAISELTDAADGVYWNVSLNKRGNPENNKLIVRDSYDSNLAWEYPPKTMFKDERVRIR